jgi:hypothetical protein
MNSRHPEPHQFLRDRNADRNQRIQPHSKAEKAAAWGAGLAFLAAAAWFGGHAVKRHLEEGDLPQPEHTGNIVRIHVNDGQGENEIVNDLHRKGVDSSELRQAIESVETADGGVPATVVDVDTGLLTHNKEHLAEYGIQLQDLKPKK